MLSLLALPAVALSMTALGSRPGNAMPQIRTAARNPTPSMKDPALELIEETVSLLPIVVPAVTLVALALDGGGVVDGQWDGVGVRRKEERDAPRRGTFAPKDTKELLTWVNANPGTKYDFEYEDGKKGLAKKLLAPPTLPRLEELEDYDPRENPLPAIAVALFLIEIALAKAAGVSSITGLLGFAAGQVAKGTFDLWNSVAPTIGLSGAILKY